MTAPLACAVEWRGREAYPVTWEHQRRLVSARTAGESIDTVVFVEHDEVITRGRKSRDLANVLDAGSIPVLEVERGGDVTWHGPGQLVAYPIFALGPDERDAPAFIRRLEGWIIGALAPFGVSGERRHGYSGVWVGGRKLASVGIGVSARWITWHGVSINVAPSLDGYRRINPCGLDADVMTSLLELGCSVGLDALREQLVARLASDLGRAPLAVA